MWATRITATVAAAFLLAGGMFWVLWYLVSGPVDVSALRDAARIDFTRMRRDTETETKREEKVERERPPVVPEAPRLTFSGSGVDNNIVALNPDLDPLSGMGRVSMTAGSDQDVLPLVRIAPDYPPRAAQRGIEGWVLVQFTITAIGSVKDPVVVDAMPKNMFEDSALKAIARWRYNPRVEGGIAVERVGVQTIIRFVLEE